jgi:two-component system nitrogen regulation sensor histidine kinase NtrY
MSGKRIWWLLIFLFLVGTTAGLFLEFFFAGSEKRKIDLQEFEQVVQQRQISLNELLKSFPDKAITDNAARWSLMDSMSRSENDLLLYENNQLVAWSNQRLPIHDVHPVFFNQPFIVLDNGYYLVQSFRRDSYLLFGLFRIKQSFPYENDYLRNRFLLQTELDVSVDIVRNQRSDYQSVFGLEGEYLFSVSNLKKQKGNTVSSSLIFIAYLIAALALWGLIVLFLNHVRFRGSVNLWLGLSLIGFSLFYFAIFWHNDMAAFSQLGLFSPIHFAMSSLLPSLGAFFLLSLYVLLLSLLVFRFFRMPVIFNTNRNGNVVNGTLFLFSFVAVQLFMLLILEYVHYLVVHSSGPSVFLKVMDINEIAVVKILILAMLFFSFSLIVEKVMRLFLFRIGPLQMCLLIGVSAVMIVLFLGRVGSGNATWGILFSALIGIFLSVVKRNYRLQHSYNTFLWLVALFALFTGTILIDQTIEKEERNRELMVENLSFQLLREEDPAAEMFLEDIERQIVRDAPLRQLLARNNINQAAVRNHLLKYYFYGYWGRYELQIVPCWPGGALVLEETGEEYNCYQYFFSILQEQGTLLNGSNHFYYLNNDNGRVSYLGRFQFFEGHPLETTLFIELQSKPYFEGLGYPELLVSQKEQSRLALFDDYSYAKYVDGRLVKRSGNYDYHGTFRQMQGSGDSKMFLKDAGYSHMVFRPEADTVIVLSRQDMGISDIFIAFSIFFIFFFVFGLILTGLTQIKDTSFSFKLSVQKRIQFSFVGLMLIILLIVAIGTVLYTVSQFKGKHDDLLNEKVQSVLLELESKIGFENSLDGISEDYLTYQLQTISNVFLCDINLFGKDGILIASSRPELFEKGLVGGQMNPSAFYNLSYGNQARFLDREMVGSLDYTSYYVPFYNRDDALLGYVNVPYFVANNELREEVSSVVMTVVNFYLLFSFVIIGIAVFLSRQITRPLLILQTKLGELKIDRQNEKINYHGDDEIGSLVKEYNRMVDELSESAAKLARTERELAWREMARQIAHEIKNPLTPMKLSIQYLQRAWKDNVPDFENFLKRVTETLIEQIEKLSSIATEFSHFAKMPAAKRENINLLEKIRSSVILFSNSSNMKIVTHLNDYEIIIINADGEQLLGVFNNLINNAIQAIPKEREGVITISTIVESHKVLITISDNGKGIPEEIRDEMFVPNFTTKTSGMGLGLAIVKGTIESSGGEIWFETQTNIGTTFYIQLPVISWS